MSSQAENVGKMKGVNTKPPFRPVQHPYQPTLLVRPSATSSALSRHNDGTILNQDEVTKAYQAKVAAAGRNPHARHFAQSYLDDPPTPTPAPQPRQPYRNPKYVGYSCLRCTQIGHIARDCPNNAAPKEMRDRLHLELGFAVRPTQAIRLQEPVAKPSPPMPRTSEALHDVNFGGEDRDFVLNRFLADDDTEYVTKNLNAVSLHHDNEDADTSDIAGSISDYSSSVQSAGQMAADKLRNKNKIMQDDWRKNKNRSNNENENPFKAKATGLRPQKQYDVQFPATNPEISLPKPEADAKKARNQVKFGNENAKPAREQQEQYNVQFPALTPVLPPSKSANEPELPVYGPPNKGKGRDRRIKKREERQAREGGVEAEKSERRARRLRARKERQARESENVASPIKAYPTAPLIEPVTKNALADKTNGSTPSPRQQDKIAKPIRPRWALPFSADPDWTYESDKGE